MFFYRCLIAIFMCKLYVLVVFEFYKFKLLLENTL